MAFTSLEAAKAAYNGLFKTAGKNRREALKQFEGISTKSDVTSIRLNDDSRKIFDREHGTDTLFGDVSDRALNTNPFLAAPLENGSYAIFPGMNKYTGNAHTGGDYASFDLGKGIDELGVNDLRGVNISPAIETKTSEGFKITQRGSIGEGAIPKEVTPTPPVEPTPPPVPSEATPVPPKEPVPPPSPEPAPRETPTPSDIPSETSPVPPKGTTEPAPTPPAEPSGNDIFDNIVGQAEKNADEIVAAKKQNAERWIDENGTEHFYFGSNGQTSPLANEMADGRIAARNAREQAVIEEGDRARKAREAQAKIDNYNEIKAATPVPSKAGPSSGSSEDNATWQAILREKTGTGWGSEGAIKDREAEIIRGQKTLRDHINDAQNGVMTGKSFEDLYGFKHDSGSVEKLVDQYSRNEAKKGSGFNNYMWGNKVPQAGAGIALAGVTASYLTGDGRRSNAQLYSSPF